MNRQHKPIVVLAVIILLLTQWTIFAQAQDTLIVSSDGPYVTINSALEDAQQGDTILVKSGTYNEQLRIDKTVSLIGEGRPIIDGGGDGSIVIISSDDVRFQGFTVRHTGRQMHHEDSGIIIQGDHVVIEDNIVEDALFGIYFAEGNNGLALNNVVYGVEELDIAMRGDGIRVWFSQHVRLEGNEVINSRDMLIWYADDITIVNNTIHNNRYGLHFMYSSNAIITGNTFSYNHVGTYLMYSQGLQMIDNTLAYNTGPSGYGLALKDMDEVVVRNNAFIGNRAGLYIDNSPSLYEGFNEFTDNYFAYNDFGVTTLPSVDRNIFTSNVFLENLQQASTRGRGDLTGNIWTQDGIGNYWSDYVGYDGDSDGFGDMPYRLEKLFDSLTDTYPELRFFLYSPASQAIDFASGAFPSLRPEPKLIDDVPLMHYAMPSGLVEASQSVSVPFLIASLILLGSGFAVILLAIRSRFIRPRQLHPSLKTLKADSK